MVRITAGSCQDLMNWNLLQSGQTLGTVTAAGKFSNADVFVGVRWCCLLPSHRNNLVEDHYVSLKITSFVTEKGCKRLEKSNRSSCKKSPDYSEISLDHQVNLKITRKTKCVRLRNGRTLQHPKQISARAIVNATGRTILVLCSCIVCTRNCVV